MRKVLYVWRGTAVVVGRPQLGVRGRPKMEIVARRKISVATDRSNVGVLIEVMMGEFLPLNQCVACAHSLVLGTIRVSFLWYYGRHVSLFRLIGMTLGDLKFPKIPKFRSS